MQRREAGVRPAALELHEQGFFGRAGEVARTFEGAIGATRTLFLLEEKIRRMFLFNMSGQIIKKKMLMLLYASRRHCVQMYRLLYGGAVKSLSM